MTTDPEESRTIWAHRLDRPPTRQWLTLADGYRTPVFVHVPPQTPTGLPGVYVHGIQSHPGWFGLSAAHLAGAGHMVFQVTRRGSGENVAARGDAPSAEMLLDDVEAACRFALGQSKSRRLCLLGVSWGSKLLAAYCLDTRRAAEVASLTLVAPGLVPRVDLGPSGKLAVAAALLCCRRGLFDIPLSDVELFTDHPPMRQYLRDDPLRLHWATARFLWASRQLDRMLVGAAGTGRTLSVPTTVLLAGGDRIVDNGRTINLLRRLGGAGLREATLESQHTIEFEADPSVFLSRIQESVNASA